MGVRLGLDQVIALPEHLDDARPGGQRVARAELVRHPVLVDDVAVLVDAADDLQPVALPDLVVVGIVAGRDLEGAGAEVGLDVLVGDHRELAADQGQEGTAADVALVALVVGVHGDAGVGQHRLRPDRGHDQVAVAVGHVVADVVERVLLLLPVDLQVADRRPAARAPVDDPRAAVDQAVVVETDEGLAHRSDVGRVHGEPHPGPVGGDAQALVLGDDAGAVGPVPLLDELLEGGSAELLLGLTLLRQLPFDDVLGGDRRVVGPGQPEDFVAQHPAVAAVDVLDGAADGVAEVELAGDVGRREHDAELGPGAAGVGGEEACLLPGTV